MSTKQAPGEKPQIEGVREQRVTVFVVNACLGKMLNLYDVNKLTVFFCIT